MEIWQSAQVKRLVALALEEDQVQSDVTTKLCLPKNPKAKAEFVAREDLVLCGLGAIEACLTGRGVSAGVKLIGSDGDRCASGAVLAEAVASAEILLSLERTILNFMQRLSGIATHVRRLVGEAQGLKILDTRKTNPGWRELEKYAVRVGGAVNHRMNLADMILVKNNHIDLSGGDLDGILRRVQKDKPSGLSVEVEVRNMGELHAALAAKPQMILLDNMDDDQIEACIAEIQRAKHRPLVEVSGGIDARRFAKLRKLGVDRVSMGSLVTKAVNVDISMRTTLLENS